MAKSAKPVQIDVTRADRKLRKAIAAMSEKEVNLLTKRAGNTLLRLNVQRIEKGIGSDGGLMKPYSPKYKAKRQATGRAVDKRTLRWTGQMMQSRLVVSVKNGIATLGWKPGKNAEKAAGNETRTPFTQPTVKERNAVLEFVRKQVKAMVKGKKPPPK